jgi:hypothetical protein
LPQDESAVADLRRRWSTIPKLISQTAVTLHRCGDGKGFVVHAEEQMTAFLETRISNSRSQRIASTTG